MNLIITTVVFAGFLLMAPNKETISNPKTIKKTTSTQKVEIEKDASKKDKKSDVKKNTEEILGTDNFLMSLLYLLEKSPRVNVFDHLETTILIYYECGLIRNIDPLIGTVIAFHESAGIQDIRAKDTGDTGLMQIKPSYAIKPSNFENYVKYTKLANQATKIKDKKEYQALADKYYKALYKYKFSIEELQQPAINVHMGCWTLYMWKNVWYKNKKDKENYLAKFAGGTNPHKGAFGFQKWVNSQVKKTKARFTLSSTEKLLIETIVQFTENTEKQLYEFFNKQTKTLMVKLFPKVKIIVADNSGKTKTKDKPKTITTAEPLYDDLYAILKKQAKKKN